jgi:hypothetical protein
VVVPKSRMIPVTAHSARVLRMRLIIDTRALLFAFASSEISVIFCKPVLADR